MQDVIHTGFKVVAAGFLTLSLAGCGARVTGLTSSAATTPSPSEILVAVAPSQDDGSSLPQQVADKIQSAVVGQLTKAHVTAEPYAAGAAHPGAAVLRIAVVQADPGNVAERFIIGFGVGKAKLAVRADLVPGDQPAAAPVLGFDASADSGAKPGLVVPGAVALGTGRVIGLAIGGGLDVASNIRGGLDRPERSTANAIVSQLKKYYASSGWQWPNA